MSDPSEPGNPGARPREREEMPRVVLTRRRVLLSVAFVGSTVAFLYFVLPKILGLRDTWNRVEHGDAWWLAAGALLELLSFVSYVVLFRAVFVRDARRIDLRVSYEITMAGLAATRLFAAAGAGGIALTAWALRAAGMEPRTVAARMITFFTLLYAVFLGALVLGGLGLYLGVLPGDAPLAITLVPGLIAAGLIVLAIVVSLLPVDIGASTRWTQGGGRTARIAARLAAAPAILSAGIRSGLRLLRSRDPQLLGAVGWYGFDAAVLWAAFHAFGGAPTVPIIVVCYFIGQLGTLLPLPGGIGGVDGAMIGAFTAFDVSGSLAVVAVLTYRAFAFWLPTVPGAVAYLQLRRTVHRWHEDETPAYT